MAAQPEDHAAKAALYDRQLRLWGTHGQKALEEAKICLVGACAVGTETLKNLVLPGIGSFTIVDKLPITAHDAKSNFFTPHAQIGQSRARSACGNLVEMNEHVHGTFVEQDIDSVLDTNPEFFKSFNVVIVCNARQSTLLRVADACWRGKVPMISLRSVGFVGQLRISVEQHQVIEAKPDDIVPDFRVMAPFPELQAFCDSFDLNQLASKYDEHEYVPYVVLLIKAVAKYTAEHGKVPTTPAEKRELRKLLTGMRLDDEQRNFKEALEKLNVLVSKPQVPENFQHIVAHGFCQHLSATSGDFWFMARAVAEFIANEGKGLLPVMGSIPDLFSSSSIYLQLSALYKEKSERDIDTVEKHLHKLLVAHGRRPDSISREELVYFVRHVRYLELKSSHAMREEFSPSAAPTQAQLFGKAAANATSQWYYVIRAAELFADANGRYPGSGNQVDLAADTAALYAQLATLLSVYGVAPSAVPESAAAEFVRWGNGELHNISAVLGGLAAQEVIKLLTHQQIPVDNTLVYDGVAGATAVLKM
eukprot:TRINITY_DN1884_c0_g1_i1.p1 TRINITY_DN1884_c0_g1~~TRINITY_DN1884_c0_g1_i1.p1  ORF type:complete len:534 (+),score=109.39 TRINITY_DN1884_c0_g1_i1:71-1672(+)